MVGIEGRGKRVGRINCCFSDSPSSFLKNIFLTFAAEPSLLRCFLLRIGNPLDGVEEVV
jgi:hypothetical protein